MVLYIQLVVCSLTNNLSFLGACLLSEVLTVDLKNNYVKQMGES